MDKQREMFEASIRKTAVEHGYPYMDNLLLKNDDCSYLTSWVDSAWLGWQAAIAAHSEVTPDVVDLAAMIMSDCGISTINSSRLQSRIAARIATYASGIDLKAMVANGFDANSGKMPSRNIINLPEPGTTEYGSWINKSKDKADQCFASHGKDRFKWLCQFEQQLYKNANGGEK